MDGKLFPKFFLFGLLLVLPVVILNQMAFGVNAAMAEEIGIQPLVDFPEQSLYALVSTSIRPLFSAGELEAFLKELEGVPPDWHNLRDLDHAKQSERLFQLNRKRDEARLVHKNILQRPIAFVWSGILRKYFPEYQGFSVALGPELTSTSWGIVRFKPVEFPDYLVATSSPKAAEELLAQQQYGEQIEIIVLFIGTLVADESLIYAFSHDGNEEGMILPVVRIQNVRYLLKPHQSGSDHFSS